MPTRREYDREYLRPLPSPLQLRIGVSTDRGDVNRFLVQLEYGIEDEWYEVVRSDHDPEASEEMSHDVTREGLHMDVYRDGEKIRTERVPDPLPPDVAFNGAEEHLTEHFKEFMEGFAQWHGIRSP